MIDRLEFKKDFELISAIGKGVSSEVYKGLRIDRGSEFTQVVAIKVFKSHRFRKKFQNELKNLSKINHPNVVSVKDWGEQGQKFYLVTEYIHGQDLSEVWKSPDFRDLKLKKYILNQVYNGIKELKDKGIAHGDLKPSNIMLSITGEVKLVDISFDDLGQAFATPEFTAPEVLSGSRASFEGDLYSLGVIASRMDLNLKSLMALQIGDRYFNYYKGVDDRIEKIKLSELIRRSISNMESESNDPYETNDELQTTQELHSTGVFYERREPVRAWRKVLNVCLIAAIGLILSFGSVPANPKLRILKLRSLDAYEFWDGKVWNSLPFDYIYLDTESTSSIKRLRLRNIDGEHTLVVTTDQDLSKNIVIDSM